MKNLMFWKQFAVALVVAMVGVLVVYLVGEAISGEFRVDTSFDENQKLEWYGPPLAILFPYGLGAAIAAALLLHFRKPRTWWYVITVLALIVFGAQAFMQTSSNETAVWLNVMHLVAAAAIVPIVARFLPER